MLWQTFSHIFLLYTLYRFLTYELFLPLYKIPKPSYNKSKQTEPSRLFVNTLHVTKYKCGAHDLFNYLLISYLSKPIVTLSTM